MAKKKENATEGLNDLSNDVLVEKINTLELENEELKEKVSYLELELMTAKNETIAAKDDLLKSRDPKGYYEKKTMVKLDVKKILGIKEEFPEEFLESLKIKKHFKTESGTLISKFVILEGNQFVNSYRELYEFYVRLAHYKASIDEMFSSDGFIDLYKKRVANYKNKQ